MPPEKLWKTASSYLRGICHKERDSLQFLSGEKKITSWTNARSCTYQRGKWTIAAHWMIRCADFQLWASTTETEHYTRACKIVSPQILLQVPATEKASGKEISTCVRSAAETRCLSCSYFKLKIKLEFETEISPRNSYFRWAVFVLFPL